MRAGNDGKRRGPKLRIALALLAVLAASAAGWFCWVYAQIEIYAHIDQVAPPRPPRRQPAPSSPPT